MKRIFLPSSAVLVFSLAACTNGSRSISSDFDPMRPPGTAMGATKATSSTYTAGQFVNAIMDNTAFFKNRPNGSSDADKLLARGTSMRVITETDSYLKVELDQGEVGYVPTVMVEDASAQPAPQGNPNEVQVYPPSMSTGMDPAVPTVHPADQPPGGAMPTVVPTEPGAVAPVVPPTSVPTISPGGAVPLPPNGEELKAMGDKPTAPSAGQ